MITSPTTEQLLADAARELRETVLPAVSDPSVGVAVEMLEQIVRACGVRSAHEIAWMREQGDELEGFCEAVLTQLPDTPGVADALDAYRQGRTDSLHLDDVIASYDRISDAASLAIEAVFDRGADDLAQRAGELMRARQEREAAVRGQFRMPGRG